MLAQTQFKQYVFIQTKGGSKMLINLEKYRSIENNCELIGYLGFAGIVFKIFC